MSCMEMLDVDVLSRERWLHSLSKEAMRGRWRSRRMKVFIDPFTLQKVKGGQWVKRFREIESHLLERARICKE